MEGKELHNQDDDDLNQGSKKKSEEDSDDFGLPDASYEDESADSDKTEENEHIEDTGATPDFESSPEYEETESSYGYNRDSYEERRTSTGLIVFLSLLGVLIIAVAIYWFFFRTPPEEEIIPPVAENVIPEDTMKQQPVIEEPKIVEQPVEEEPQPPSQKATFETINSKTGRYYVVLNSFFDEDLAQDYAKSLANQGVSTKILVPEGRKVFKRVVFNQDFSTFGDAASQLNDLRSTYGDNIWVLKF